MHRMRNPCYAVKIPEDALLAIDMRLEDFPIVDPRLARRAGVSQHKSRFNLLGQDRNGFAVNSVGIEMDRAHAAVERGIVILTSSRHLNDLRFDVLRDYTHLLERQMAAGKACERRRGRNH